MVLDAVKCHFLSVDFNEAFPDFSFKDTAIESFTEEKIFEVVNNHKLFFKFHLKNISKRKEKRLTKNLAYS